MTKGQIFLVVGALLVVGAIYFGLDTTAPDHNKNNAFASGVLPTSIENLLKEARDSIPQENRALVESLMSENSKIKENDSLEIASNIEISSEWYRLGFPLIAGHFAEKVAATKNTAEAWGIAGTTYSIGMKNAIKDKYIVYGREKALSCLDMAITMDTANMDYRINKALIHVERPVDSPMKGIMMLKELNQKFPRSVKVLNQLAQLAIRTAQWDKAIERLQSAIGIEPTNRNTICLLAQAYQGKGEVVLAKEYYNKCNN